MLEETRMKCEQKEESYRKIKKEVRDRLDELKAREAVMKSHSKRIEGKMKELEF